MPTENSGYLSPTRNVKQKSKVIRRPSDLGSEKSAYERVLYNLHHDAKWLKEVRLGLRVGFYRFRGELGHGNFSVVKLAQHQLTRDKVAIKVVEKSKLEQKTQRMLSREISNMDLVGHPNIIRLFEVVETLSRIHLVLEFAPAGELYNRITSHGKFDESDAKYIYSQILSAVVYLHSIAIVHRDIKAENVFMMSNTRVKLGDFGFSTKISKHRENLLTFCGSPPYAAPELYKDESYNGPAVDVWALGVLLFFILTADMPYKASTVVALKRQILGGTFLIPLYLTESARDLINQLMNQHPKERPPSHEISSHSWFYGAEICGQYSLPSHIVLPRSLEDTELLTEEEKLTYKCLEDWGLSRTKLSQASQHGARSILVGTYRILMYRLFNSHCGDAISENGSRRHSLEAGHSGMTTPTHSRSPRGSSSSSPLKSKFKLYRRFSKCSDKNSKSCVIL